MNTSFTQTPQAGGSPVRLSNLSPERYGNTALNRNLSYSPSKLQSNFIYREVSVTKKVQTEKNRIRQLESLNSLLEEKTRHLLEQNKTLKLAFQQQIEMYKKILREQEEEAKRLIKNLQTEYAMEISKILLGHEEDAKVAQGEKEQYERKIDQLSNRIQELETLLHRQNQNVYGLTGNLNMTSQKLINTEDKLQRSEFNAEQLLNRLNSQINGLTNRLHQQTSNFKRQLDSFNKDKQLEIEALKRLHLAEMEKFQNGKDAEMGTVSMELRDIKDSFEAEAYRLQEMINNKEIVNESLGIELMREKERVAALCRNYDIEINRLVSEKDRLICDLNELNHEKNIISKDLQELAFLFEGEKARNSVLITSLQTEIGNKNMQMAGDNQRLVRTVEQYERQLLVAGSNMNALHKTLDIEKGEEIRRLILEIKSLKEVLIESSNEMDRCKEQFLRMEMEIERLILVNCQYEQESIRLKSLLSEQDIQLRIRRI